MIGALIDNGFVIVAAVGNDGPAAPPLYPASYARVVGVTAVDAHRRVLIEAARGPQVMFASPGADMRRPAPVTPTPPCEAPRLPRPLSPRCWPRA